MTDAIAHHAALDQRMVRAARGIRLLTLASWPASVQEDFLRDWRKGRAVLPQVEYPQLDFSEARTELQALARAADPDHPLGAYVRDSARQWELTARMLEALGTPEAGALSVSIASQAAGARIS